MILTGVTSGMNKPSRLRVINAVHLIGLRQSMDKEQGKVLEVHVVIYVRRMRPRSAKIDKNLETSPFISLAYRVFGALTSSIPSGCKYCNAISSYFTFSGLEAQTCVQHDA